MRKRAWKKFITTNPWLKLLSLLLAIVLWFFVVSQGSSVIVMEIPIGFRNLPSHLEVLNGPKSVSIWINGQERLLKELRQGDVNVAIDLSGVKKGNIFFPLSSEDVTLPKTLTVTDISPQTIKLNLEEKVTKTVPVRAIIVGTPARGFTVSRMDVIPKMIEIRGTESVIEKVYSVQTEPIDITGISGNLSYRAYLDVNNIKVSVQRVDIRITITEVQ
jgi:YbbR domain-containing protein